MARKHRRGMQQQQQQQQQLQQHQQQQQPMHLGRDFNPLKFDFQPMPIRDFNPLKFDFEVAPAASTDVLDLMPEWLAPRQGPSGIMAGLTSHQSHHFMNEESAPVLDSATTSLLDSLQLKFALDNHPQQQQQISSPPYYERQLEQTQWRRHEVKSVAKKEAVVQPPAMPIATTSEPDTKNMAPEQLRVLRNKAVQKRYRQRKKNESMRQQDVFGTTKANLAMAQARAPAQHVVTVDKLLILRRLNKERDGEIQRLRKLLQNVKASKAPSGGRNPGSIMVHKDGGKVDDFVDEDIECVVPGKLAKNAAGEVFIGKWAQVGLNDQIRAVVQKRFSECTSPRFSNKYA